MDKLRKKHSDKEIQLLKDILTFGVQNNEFILDIEAEIDLTSYIIVSAYRSIMIDLVFGNELSDWNAKQSVLVQILIRGLKK